MPDIVTVNLIIIVCVGIFAAVFDVAGIDGRSPVLSFFIGLLLASQVSAFIWFVYGVVHFARKYW